MEFPVDILANVDPESLEHSAKDYMSKLLYRNPEKHEYLSIPGSEKVEIGLCNVGFVPLHGANTIHKVLALFSPVEKSKAVGLYLLDKWWSAEDILKTVDPTRTGLFKVKTTVERIVLYVLNRIIYRTKESAGGDVNFLCHGKDDIAKILWKNGEAVGFYSVKPEGALCSDYLTQCYELPIMDSIFIRNCHRRKGYGLQMLEDFVRSFKTDCMGLQYPLSLAMYKVCKKYLSLHPQDTEFLWETEGVGCRFQRTPLARKLQAMDPNENHQVTGNAEDTDDHFPMGVSVDLVEGSMQYTEDVEEVVQVKRRKVVSDTDVTTYCRSCCLKQTKLATDTEMTHDKNKRVEDMEPEGDCSENDLVHADSEFSFREDTVETAKHDVTSISEISHLHCEEQNIMSRKAYTYSETGTEQVIEPPPVMEILNNEVAQTSEVVVASEKEKNTVEERSSEKRQETKDQEPSPDNKEKKVSTLTQQDENVTPAYSSGSKGKHDKRTSNYKTLLRSSMRLDDQAAQSELAERVSGSISKKTLSTISKHMHTRHTQYLKQPEEIKQVQGEPKYEGLNQTEFHAEPTGKEQVVEIAENENVEENMESVNTTATLKENEINNEKSCLDQQKIYDQNLMEVENDMGYENKMAEKLRNEEPDKETASAAEVGKTSKDGKQIGLVDVHFETAEKMIDVKAHEPSASVHIEEQEEEPAVETLPAADGNSKGAPVGLPVNMRGNENVLVVKDKTEKLNVKEPDVRHDKIMENILSKDDDIVSEPKFTDVSKMAEAQEDEPMREPEIVQTVKEQVPTLATDETKMEMLEKEKALKETNSIQGKHDEEIKSKPITVSSDDEERVKLDVHIELSKAAENETSFVTPLRRSTRVKHQAAESEMTTMVLRSATKANKTTYKTNAEKQQLKTKQTIDHFEDEWMTDVLVSHSETAVKDVQIEVGAKTSEQSAAEHLEEQEEKMASEDDEADEAILTCATDVHLNFDKSLTPTAAGEDDIGISQPQEIEEVDLETHKPESIDTESLAENAGKKTDEKVKSVALNDEDKLAEAIITDESVQKEADAAQETPHEEPKRLHADKSKKSKVLTKLAEKDEMEASSVSPLRRSQRLQGQAAVSELKMRILGSSANLTGKDTPQCRQNEQIQTMMLEEEPGQLDEAKNNEMNIISGTKAAEGEHMESVTVHVFAEGEPENMTLFVQRTSEDGGNFDNDYIETDDNKNLRASNENQVEVTEQDKTAPGNIMHGEAEQFCTTPEKSAENIEPSEAVKEIENKVQEDRAVKEMVHGEESDGVMETTSLLTLQKASVVLMDVKKVLPSLTCDCSPAQEVFSDTLETSEQAADMPEEMREELQTGVVEGETVHPIVGETGHLNKTAKDTAEEESNVGIKHLKDGTNDTRKLKDKKSGDNNKMEEEFKTGQFTLQDPILTQDSVHEECSETTTHVQDILDLHNTEVEKDLISAKEHEDELAASLALGRQTGGNASDSEATQSQDVELLAKTHYADEKNALVQMDVTEPVSERIEKEIEEAVELGTENTLITYGKQGRDICAEESMKSVLIEKTTSTECEASTTPAHGDSVKKSTKDISVSTSRNLARRTLPAKLTPERKASRLHTYKAHEYTGEEISDEEVETVFTRRLRRRTITVTVSPRRSEHLTSVQVAEPETGRHVTKVVTVQSTEVTRTAVEETQETYSKKDNEEVHDDTPEETFEKELAKRVDEKHFDVKSPAENQATDQGKEKGDDNNMVGEDTKLVTQEDNHGEANREQQSTTEESSCENNASKAVKLAYEHKQTVATQAEPELCEKIAEEMTEASNNFTLVLDEEFDHSEIEITDAEQDPGVMTPHILRGRKSASTSAQQRSTGRSRRLLQDSPSKMENRYETEEVEDVIGEDGKQKRKAEVELTPRRSKRLARTNIM